MESHTLSPRRQLYDKGLRVVLYFWASSPARCWF